MGYLVCEKCEGYYELQENESPQEFVSCECGGNLKYAENLSDYFYIPEKPTTKRERSFLGLFKFKALFLGAVAWLIIDSQLYGVPYYNLNDYYLGNIALFSLVASQIISSVITGYLSGKQFKSGIFNGVILGILFSIALFFLKSNPEMTSLMILGLLILLGCIGGAIGVFIKKGVSGLISRIRKKEDESGAELLDMGMDAERINWPRDLAGWLFGGGVLLLFFSYTLFGGILLFIAALIYVSGNSTAIYAGIGGYLSYSLIQMMIGVSNILYGNLSIYERENWQVLVAITVVNMIISIYVIIRTWKISK